MIKKENPMRDHHHFLFYARHAERDHVFLDADEAHHAATVLRLGKGDPFMATDGSGTLFTCSFESKTGQGLTGVIVERATVPRHSRRLRVLIGLPERAAFESLLVDLAALGVERITPIICSHCQKAWWENDWKKYRERLGGKMVSAMKQSLYPWLPVLDPPADLAAAGESLGENVLAADPEGIPFRKAMAKIQTNAGPLSAVVGPPGGFDTKELFALRERGAIPVKIAETRLTTELAAVVMSALIVGSGV